MCVMLGADLCVCIHNEGEGARALSFLGDIDRRSFAGLRDGSG